MQPPLLWMSAYLPLLHRLAFAIPGIGVGTFERQTRRRISSHSLRIGGATALFAAGADPIHIRTMGRWSSDCYRLYVRSCFEQTLAWTAKIGSQSMHDVQGTYERRAQETECY